MEVHVVIMRYVSFLSFSALIILSGCGSNEPQVGFSYSQVNQKKPIHTSGFRRHNNRISLKRPSKPKKIVRLYESVKKTHKKKPHVNIGPILNKPAARNAINAYRVSHGLKPLNLDKKLEEAAHIHSTDMAKADKPFHIGPNGNTPWSRVVKYGYKPVMTTENIGVGQTDFQTLLKSWQESEGHNANLLVPDATDMGIALVYDKNTKRKTFWTLVIARRK